MPVVQRQHGGPSCLDKVKYGVMTGLVLGMCTGALFGGFGGLRYGLRGRELIRFVGKSMAQTSGTIAVFIGIGSALRC